MKPSEIRTGGVYFNRIEIYGKPRPVKHYVLNMFTENGVEMVAYENELQPNIQFTSQLVNFAAQMQGEYL